MIDSATQQRIARFIDRMVREGTPEQAEEAAGIAADLVRDNGLTLVECIRDPRVRSGAYWFRPVQWPGHLGSFSVATNDNASERWIQYWERGALRAAPIDPRFAILDSDFVCFPALRRA